MITQKHRITGADTELVEVPRYMLKHIANLMSSVTYDFEEDGEADLKLADISLDEFYSLLGAVERRIENSH